MTETTGALARCAGDADVFAAEIFGRRPHLHHDDSGYDDLLSLADVDRLICSAALRTPAFRLVRDGRPLPAGDYTRHASINGVPLTGLADPDKILRLLDDGATFVLQGAHRYHPPLALFLRDLELTLGHSCQVNAYITPPGARGLATHEDSHDVFVLQCFGHKRWTINGDEGGELELGPGDALYLPKGTPHAARAQQTLSGHLTVGIRATSWRDAVNLTLATIMDHDVRMTESLPAGYHRDPSRFAALLAEHVSEIVRSVDKLDPREVAEAQIDRFLTTRPPAQAGGLIDRTRLAEMTVDSVVRRRAGSVCELRRPGRDGDQLRVLLGDRELRVPAWLVAAMDLIATRAEFRPAELGLDDESALVLIRRLVREGLLELAGE